MQGAAGVKGGGVCICVVLISLPEVGMHLCLCLSVHIRPLPDPGLPSAALPGERRTHKGPRSMAGFCFFYLWPFCALHTASGILSRVSKMDCFGGEGLRLGCDPGERLLLMGHWKHSSSHVLLVYKSVFYMSYKSSACLSTAASLAQ